METRYILRNGHELNKSGGGEEPVVYHDVKGQQNLFLPCHLVYSNIVGPVPTPYQSYLCRKGISRTGKLCL